jgi:hypothetical protein
LNLINYFRVKNNDKDALIIEPKEEIKVEALRKRKYNVPIESSNDEDPNSDDEMIKGCRTDKNYIEEEQEHGMNIEKPKSCYSYPRMKFIPLVAYPYVGAFMASISTMMVRVFTGFHSEDPPEGHDDNFYGFSPYVFGFLLIFCSIGSYFIINKGLEAFESVYVAPLFKVGGMIFNLTTGGYMLDEFSDYDDDQTRFYLFLSGCLICIFGIILLVHGNDRNIQEEAGDEGIQKHGPEQAPKMQNSDERAQI